MCSISWGFLCLHIRRLLCYTAKNSKIVSYSFAVATYPREGTETNTANGISLKMFQLQLIPARGRKHICLNQTGRYIDVATYPREGTETCSARAISPGAWLQLIPARGRKQNSPRFRTYREPLQLIPARGRKQFQIQAFFLSTMLQLIPARGRKLDLLQLGRIVVLVATYPREGTETSLLIIAGQPCSIRCNLSPRGDGNPRTRSKRIGSGADVATYPREGTETAGR